MNKNNKLLMGEEESAMTELMWLDEDQPLQLDDETLCLALEESADCEMTERTESSTDVTAATLSAIAMMKQDAYGMPSVRRRHQQVDSHAQPRRGTYRQQQKQEIESLRSQVFTLEYELRFLQANRISFNASGSVEGDSTHTIDSAPQFARISEPRAAIGNDDVDMMSHFDAPSWKAVATHEYETRELAERENQVLKQDLKRQLRLIKNVQSSLLQIRPDPVAQAYLPREEDVAIDQRSPISTSDWSSLDENTSNMDTDAFAELLDASDDELMSNMISLGLQLLFVPWRKRSGKTDERQEAAVQRTSPHGVMYTKRCPMRQDARSSHWRAESPHWNRRSNHERFVDATESRNPTAQEAAPHDQRSRQRGWLERLPSSFRSRTLFRACFYLEQQLISLGIAGKVHCVDSSQLLRVGKFSDNALHSYSTDSPTEPVASGSVLRSVAS